MTSSRNEIYFRFFSAVQSIEDILNVVAKRTHRFDEDITLYRDGLEHVVDGVIRLAAERDWPYAYNNGEFIGYYQDFDHFAKRHWNDILTHEEMRIRR